MNKFALHRHPSSFYRERFDPSRLSVLPNNSEAVFQIEAGELSFDLLFEVHNGKIVPDLISQAESTLSHITELDDIARRAAQGGEMDYEEHLEFITFRPNEIEFRYVSSIVNTDWGAYFHYQNNNSFKFNGLG